MFSVWANSSQEALIKILRGVLEDLQMSIIMLIKGNFEFRTGVGKSYLALKLGELIDKDFSIEKVVFEPKDFKRAIELMEEKYYQVMVIDEAGLLINAKKWMSFINEALRTSMMVLRNLRCLCILVSPAMRFVDPDVRRLITFATECSKHFKREYGKTEKRFVFAKFYKLNWHEIEDRFYFSRLKYIDKNTKRECIIGKLKIELPSENLIEEYEEKSTPFKKKKMESYLLEFGEDFFEKKEPGEIIQDILENRDKLVVGNKISSAEVRTLYKVDSNTALFISKRVNKALRELECQKKTE